MQEARLVVGAGGDGAFTVTQPVQRLIRLKLAGQHGAGLLGKNLPQRQIRPDGRLPEQGQGARVDRLDGAVGIAGDEAGLRVVDEVQGVGALHLLQLLAKVAQVLPQLANLVPSAGLDRHIHLAGRHPGQILAQHIKPPDQPPPDQHHQHEDAEQDGEGQHHQDHQLAGRHHLAAVVAEHVERAVRLAHRLADLPVITRDGIIQLGTQGHQPLMGQGIGLQQPVQLAIRFHQGNYVLQDLAIADGRGVLGQAGGEFVHLVDLVTDEQEGALQILLVALVDHLIDQRLQLILLEGEILQGGELLDDIAKFAHVVGTVHHAGQVPLHLLQQGRHVVHQILMQPVAALLQLLQRLGMGDLLLQVVGVIRHQGTQIFERPLLGERLVIILRPQQVGILDILQCGGDREGEPLVLHRVPGIPQLRQQQQQTGTGPLQLVGAADGGQALFDDQIDLLPQPIPHHVSRHPHDPGQGRDGHEGEDQAPSQAARQTQAASQATHGLLACSTSRCASFSRASVVWRHWCITRSAWGLL